MQASLAAWTPVVHGGALGTCKWTAQGSGGTAARWQGGGGQTRDCRHRAVLLPRGGGRLHDAHDAMRSGAGLQSCPCAVLMCVVCMRLMHSAAVWWTAS